MSYHISSRAKETDKGLGEIQLWFMGMDVDVDVDIFPGFSFLNCHFLLLKVSFKAIFGLFPAASEAFKL